MADQDSVSETGSVSQDEQSQTEPVTKLSQLPPYVPEEIQGEHGIKYITYSSEAQLPWISKLMEADLSEPYSVFTYRYFINQWPKLTWMAMDGDTCVGAIVSKLDRHKGKMMRGYIAMLAVDKSQRSKGIGSQLVLLAVNKMKENGCEEVVLETELSNTGAQRLYKRLGFIKDKRLARYYMNGNDAFRLKLWLRDFSTPKPAIQQ